MVLSNKYTSFLHDAKVRLEKKVLRIFLKNSGSRSEHLVVIIRISGVVINIIRAVPDSDIAGYRIAKNLISGIGLSDIDEIRSARFL